MPNFENEKKRIKKNVTDSSMIELKKTLFRYYPIYKKI